VTLKPAPVLERTENHTMTARNALWRCALGLAGLLLAGAAPPPATRPAAHAERPLKVKVAAVQCPSDLGDVKGNRERLSKLVEEAAANGAKIVVLPEAAITGYLSQDLKTNWHFKGWPIEKAFAGKDPEKFAETVPGPSTGHFATLAKKLGVYVTVPIVEVQKGRGRQEARFFNTVCLVSPEGKLVAHYRKLTPWPYPEKSWATEGDLGVATYDTEYGRVGLAICFDIHTILPKYKPHDIWALLYPIAWVDDEHPADWFYHRLPEKVGQFKHYVIGANWSIDEPNGIGPGPGPDWRGYGFSPIISPEGKVIAAAKSLYGNEIVYAEIDTAWGRVRRADR
jgi:predicted amidohydrolase